LWLYLPSGKRYGRTWLASRQPFGEILQQALKPLRYLFLLFLQAKKAKSHLEHQPRPSV